MLYPRIATLNGQDVLVDDAQMCKYREHMTRSHRILFFSGVISGDITPHDLMLTLDTLSHDPIYLVITSPGGDLDTTFLFYDVMKMIKSPVITIGRYCASAGALLLVAGTKRYLFPHAKVLLHLATGKSAGDVRDWEIQHKQMQIYQNKAVDILIENGCRKSREEILKDIDRDYWLEPPEAIEYGLADGLMDARMWGQICR